MNAKFLKRLRISLAIVGLTFLMLSIFARFTEIEFLSAFNQWLFAKFGIINFPTAYLLVAMSLTLLDLLLQQIKLNLQNKANKSV